MKILKLLFLFILGIAKVEAQVSDLYIEKALQGDAESMYYLSKCYERGLGVEKNRSKQMEWFMKSAEKKYHEALYELAQYYEAGDYGFEIDSVRAYSLYNQSAQQKNLFAMLELGLSYRNFALTEGSRERSVKYLKEISDGEYVLGHEEFWGKQDATVGLFKSLAEHELYLLYQGNDGVTRNEDLSLHYLKKSVNHGEYTSLVAMNTMGECFLNGNGVKKDKEEAIKWFEKSSCSLAKGNLGIIYYEEGLYDKAFQFLKEACDDDMWPSPKSMHKLHGCYKYGRGTRKNKELADYWLKEAANHGELNAMELLILLKRNKE